MTSVKYWLWLTTRTGLSLDGIHRTLTWFGTPEAAYYAADGEYEALTTLKPVAKASLRDKSMGRADRILSDCDRLNVRICTMQDAEYPERLKNIYLPPLVLYSRGKQIYFDEEVAIAVAGTRNCSDYGRRMAGKLSYEIIKNGGMVVTGVVPGCDYAAATSAVRAGGPVACVLAGGVDVPFDSRSAGLYEQVMKCGVLISEHPPGREPRGRNFPERNRILTGLCVGTLCVEGNRTSGVMLVAKQALDQNRDVFVVPTGADRPEGAGILDLLKDGAAPVTSGREILESYAVRFPERLHVLLGKKPQKRTAPEPERVPMPRKPEAEPPKTPEEVREEDCIDLAAHRDEYTDNEAAILRCLQDGERTADEILAETDIPAGQGLTALTILTLRGLISEEDGGRFRALVRVK